LIYNPTAGSFPSGVISQQIAAAVSDYGWDMEIALSHSGEHVAELAAEAAQLGYTAVFVAGGDGTINLALKGLVGTETALGVLPGGTANVLAQELGLTNLHFLRANKMVDAARRLVEGCIQETDVGYCNGNPFLLWAGIGLDGFIIHRIEPRKPWEKQLSVLHYASKAVWNLHFWSGIQLKIDTGAAQLSGNYLMAVASNIRLYVGGLAELSPSAMLDDGKMDLWMFEGKSPIDAYQRALDLFSKRHLNSEHMICLPFEQAIVQSETTLYTQLDAEPYETEDRIDLCVRARQLRLMVPVNISTKLYKYPPVQSFHNLNLDKTESESRT
jgi:diacylglycerol kinase family enzyme